MNRFNKIMLLGLLSIITGATSVKGMANQFAAVQVGGKDSKFFVMPNPGGANTGAFDRVARANGITKFISLARSNKSASHKFFDMDNATVEAISELFNNFNNSDIICVYPKYKQVVSTSDKIEPVEMAKIATLYVCWALKTSAVSPFTGDGKVNICGSNIELNGRQKELALAYGESVKTQKQSISSGAGTSAAVAPKVETVVEPVKHEVPAVAASGVVLGAPATPVQAKRNIAKMIAFYVAKGLSYSAAAFLAYCVIGNIVYHEAGCQDASTSGTCMVTAPANVATAATLQFLADAGTAIAAGATIACDYVLKAPVMTYAKKELPLVSLFNQTMTPEVAVDGSSCSKSIIETLNPLDCAPFVQQEVASVEPTSYVTKTLSTLVTGIMSVLFVNNYGN